MALFTKIATNNYNLVICSTIIGFCFWYFLSTMRIIEINVTVPLSFYGELAEKSNFETVESLSVCLKGHKRDFYNLHFKNLAAHINANEFHLGENNISITSEHLFLPQEIKLVSYKPSNIVVIVKNKNTQ